MVTMTLTFPIVDGRFDEFVEFLEGILPQTYAFGGCERFEVYADRAESSVMVFEAWTSMDRYQEYTTWREQSGTLAPLASYLRGAPTLTLWEPVTQM